jgi:anaerobic selenocysteine-containing dehydrogenase
MPAHTEIFRRLARAMGYDEPELYATDEQIAADVLDVEGFAAAGVTLESLRETGFARIPGTHHFQPFLQSFPTPSGRFEFVSDRAERDGHGRLPSYRPPAESVAAGGVDSSEDSGLALVAAASDAYVNSTFAGTRRVRQTSSEPSIVVHPHDALARGLVDGARVEVGDGRGRFQARLVVSDDARPGVAVSTKGWWGQGLNATVAEGNADMARGPIFHDNRVWVSPVP